jgi:hypothetical protein
LAPTILYAIVLRLPSGRHLDGGTASYPRQLRAGASVQHAGERWLVDHVVTSAEPPLVYLVASDHR